MKTTLSSLLSIAMLAFAGGCAQGPLPAAEPNALILQQYNPAGTATKNTVVSVKPTGVLVTGTDAVPQIAILGDGLTLASGTLSAAGGGAQYTLPTATASELGGIKIGANLTISNGVLAGAAPYTLPAATASALGGVKVGANLTIANGILSGAAPYTLPTATESALGGVKVGTGITFSSGVISIPSGTAAPVNGTGKHGDIYIQYTP